MYKAYVDEFGAGIDIKAFLELYLGRDEAYRVRNKTSDGPKIPKGMDLNFLHPKGKEEEEIEALIDTYNLWRVSESEQELFKQVKRLADAERRLAVKETQTALNNRRIATNKITQ